MVVVVVSEVVVGESEVVVGESVVVDEASFVLVFVLVVSESGDVGESVAVV